jgi:hypothetical protein
VSHTYTNILIHAVFSTKYRRPWLSAEVREEGSRYEEAIGFLKKQGIAYDPRYVFA